MKSWWFVKTIKFLVFAALAITIFSLIVMVVWNAVVPDLFGGPALGFWHAAGLLVLSQILLRGWGPWQHAHGWRHEKWRKRFEERYASLSPEEREKVRHQWRRHCGPCDEDASEQKKPE